MASPNRKSTDLTPLDQARLQRIVDNAAEHGIELDFPKAIRAALTAWEKVNEMPPLTPEPVIADGE